ncbi:head maturation protease, ClpP-related [Paremcibacter congregatus]|uniref:head maturation protease, ClpP-related n=1 Tax=Paremcibacter congregatus TaxID=2043170 RepID=UPI003A8F8490
MTIRKLPTINAFKIDGVEFDAPSDALDRWNAAVRSVSAAGGAGNIEMYDIIGEDPWTGGGITAASVAESLRSASDVTVSINSPGGDFFEGIAIYNLLRAHPHKVTVNVVGLAASAASVIAMAGDEIRVARAGFIMIHNAWSIAIGNRHDFMSVSKTLEKFDSQMAELYAARAEIDPSVAAQFMDDETWLSGESAIDQGFADSFLAADDVVTDPDADDGGTRAAIRSVDIAMAKQGTPRSKRRSVLNKIRGTQDAAPPAMPCAGDLAAVLADLKQTISTR